MSWSHATPVPRIRTVLPRLSLWALLWGTGAGRRIDATWSALSVCNTSSFRGAPHRLPSGPECTWQTAAGLARGRADDLIVQVCHRAGCFTRMSWTVDSRASRQCATPMGKHSGRSKISVHTQRAHDGKIYIFSGEALVGGHRDRALFAPTVVLLSVSPCALVRACAFCRCS